MWHGLRSSADPAQGPWVLAASGLWVRARAGVWVLADGDVTEDGDVD